MPITSRQITENNGDKVFKHTDILVETFIKNWVMQGHIIFPEWQREDCWPDEYRVQLIESILTRNDIPKFYLSRKNGEELYYLLDGGHRTRSIWYYIENKFAVMIDGDSVYYDKIPEQCSERKNRVMNAGEKTIFDNYKLTLSIYENLTEKDSRIIFNILQNSQPMTMADIINSYESPLIDYLRSLYSFEIDGQKLEDVARSVKDSYLPPNENSKLLYHLVSIWTIVIPFAHDDKTGSALSYSLKGEKRDSSMCYKYIKEYNDDINDEDKKRFEGVLSWYIKTLKFIEEQGFVKKKTLKSGECLSMIHSHLYVRYFSIHKFLELIGEEREYERIKKETKELMSNPSEFTAKKKEYESIDSNYNYSLSEWAKGYSNINKDHMTRRYNIIKEFCINAPIGENSDNQSEEATEEPNEEPNEAPNERNITTLMSDSVGMEVISQ